jgi:hypothetical protein
VPAIEKLAQDPIRLLDRSDTCQGEAFELLKADVGRMSPEFVSRQVQGLDGRAPLEEVLGERSRDLQIMLPPPLSMEPPSGKERRQVHIRKGLK